MRGLNLFLLAVALFASTAAAWGGCGGRWQTCCNDHCDGQWDICKDGKCQPCGLDWQQCCPHDECQSNDKVCHNGRCEPCGKRWGKCCPHQDWTWKCKDPYWDACQNGTCQPCGMEGVAICPKGNPCKGDLEVFVPKGCHSKECKICRHKPGPSCGAEHGLCCESGWKCQHPWLSCNMNGHPKKCERKCGHTHEACCPGATPCKDWRVCKHGKCIPCGGFGQPECNAGKPPCRWNLERKWGKCKCPSHAPVWNGSNKCVVH